MLDRRLVLIVDDVPLNIRVLALALRSEYTVKVASNGREALDIAQQVPQPDIILLDVMMPDMDGFEVCRRLKSHASTRDIPVVFVTAKSEAVDEETGLRLGAVDYITKPFSIPITRARIRNHIQHKIVLETLRKSEDRLNYSLEAGGLGAWRLDAKTHTVWRSEIHARLFGDDGPLPDWSFDDLLARIHQDDRGELQQQIEEALRARTFVQWEGRILRKDGAVRWFWVRGKPEISALEELVAIHGVMQDITERKQAEEAAQLATLAFQNASEGFFVTDAEGTILAINPAFTRITGYAPSEVIGKNPRILQSGRQDSAFYRAMWHRLTTVGYWHGEIWNRRKDGEIYAEWLTINSIFNKDGTVNRRVALFSDITKRKQSEELIWKQANFDPLTELPNRRLFLDRLEQAIKKARRSDLPLALMFIDLDRFKEVNDTLGHEMGDLLLKQAAERLNHCVREIDTVARLGGDEFTVILAELDDTESIARVTGDILRSLAEPFPLGNEMAHISASLGITFYPKDAVEAEVLIRNADQAMYAAKYQGRNGCCYFSPSMQGAPQKRMS